MTDDLEQAYERLLAKPGVVFLLGGIDSGKTTFALELLKRAVAQGQRAALVDADIAQSTVGPPTTVGMKLLDGSTEFSRDSLRVADGLAFVGAVTPHRHLLPLVTGTGKLVARARSEGARTIVVDSTSSISGLEGQMLKYFKMDAIAPDAVVAFEHGGDLELIVGVAQRFTGAEILELPVSPNVVERTVEERMVFREEQFAAYFAQKTSRWRVRPTVFMPAPPPEFDSGLFDSLVVGMEDGQGSCVGIGVLEYDADEDILRMVSPVTEGVRGLRLGSVRIDTEGRSLGPVDLRELFSTE